LRSWSALDALLDIYLRATRPTGHSKSSAAGYPESCATDHSKPSAADHSESGAANCSEPSVADLAAADRVPNSYADADAALTAW